MGSIMSVILRKDKHSFCPTPKHISSTKKHARPASPFGRVWQARQTIPSGKPVISLYSDVELSHIKRNQVVNLRCPENTYHV